MDDVGVRFWDAYLSQPLFDIGDQASADAASPEIGRDCQVIDIASSTIVPSHHRPDERVPVPGTPVQQRIPKKESRDRNEIMVF